ncbi:unnamed protein product, partial [Allacma fusca]
MGHMELVPEEDLEIAPGQCYYLPIIPYLRKIVPPQDSGSYLTLPPRQ